MQLDRRPPTAPASTHPDWRRGFQSLWDEYDYWIDDVEGTIPPELYGTLWRNGPGVLDRGGVRFGHPFDGDGMICRIAFGNGRAHFRNRFVRTKGWLREQQAGKILYRGVFGTEKPGGIVRNIFDLRVKHIANTNIVYWGHSLWALWEGAHPYRLDPWTLDTLGPDDLGGLLGPFHPFAAHPHVDPHSPDGTARLIGFSVVPGFRSAITIYEFDLNGHVVEQHRYTIPGYGFFHDVAITPRYYIFFQGPLTVNPVPYVLGWRGLGECLYTKEQAPTRTWIFPRHGQGPAHMLQTDSCFIFHHANAFETEGGVTVDSVVYPTYPMSSGRPAGRDVFSTTLPAQPLWRFHLDLRARTVKRQRLTSWLCEFPVVHAAHVGRPYRYVYVGATRPENVHRPLEALMKVDLEQRTSEVWSAGPQSFVNEPLFVPRAGPARCTALAAPLDSIPRSTTDSEDDGWLIVLTYEAEYHRSDIVILDARNLTNGPIARLRLRHHVPYGFHGSFTPQRFGPEP
jgi:all-trans-8'-apo-beta-carotenal 15,15'-oxygenase